MARCTEAPASKLGLKLLKRRVAYPSGQCGGHSTVRDLFLQLLGVFLADSPCFLAPCRANPSCRKTTLLKIMPIFLGSPVPKTDWRECLRVLSSCLTQDSAEGPSHLQNPVQGWVRLPLKLITVWLLPLPAPASFPACPQLLIADALPSNPC